MNEVDICKEYEMNGGKKIIGWTYESCTIKTMLLHDMIYEETANRKDTLKDGAKSFRRRKA